MYITGPENFCTFFLNDNYTTDKNYIKIYTVTKKTLSIIYVYVLPDCETCVYNMCFGAKMKQVLQGI